jgi:hypothetical protein
MRDIRQDIRERLDLVEARRSSLERALKALNDEADALMRVLEAEDRRFLREPLATRPDGAMADFIVSEIDKRPLSKDEVLQVLERAGYLDGIEAPGRSVHLTLVNLRRGGRIRIADDEKYHPPVRRHVGPFGPNANGDQTKLNEPTSNLGTKATETAEMAPRGPY